jgi:hypothetical protein
VRLYEIKFEGKPPLPEVHWPDHDPLAIEGTWPEKLNSWLTLVQRGEVINAYRVFLGLWQEAMEDPARRTSLLAQLVFAGLIDVQDRVLHNRSYTTGHKSYRARAAAELARAVGWANAHPILYAGVPDIAVGPRWYSTYEMGCLVGQNLLDNRDRELLAHDGALTPVESMALQEAILSGQEPAFIDLIVALLKTGRGHRQIIDTIQLASAQLIMETGDPNSYSMPQHSYEYCNTVRWFFDTFEHPHRLKLLFVAAAFVTRAAHHQKHTPGNHPVKVEPPKGSDALTPAEVLRRLDGALDGLRAFGQRPAQPGAGHLPARRLPPFHRGRSRPPAARLGQAHRRPPEIRQPPRRLAALRRRVRPRPLLTNAQVLARASAACYPRRHPSPEVHDETRHVAHCVIPDA